MLPLDTAAVLTKSKRPILFVSLEFLETIRKGVDVGTKDKRPRLSAGGIELVLDECLPYKNECGEEVHVLAVDGELLKTGRFC
jgi:hypothetical protein